MGVSQLQGTPWHIEYLKKDEADKDEKRRHKNRCKYYKHFNKCKLTNIHDKCFGSNNCRDYKEDLELKEKNKFEPVDVDKEKQRKRLAQIQAKNEKSRKVHKLKVGLSFELEDLQTGELIKYKIVEKDDEDIFDNKITADSPIALKVAQVGKDDLINIETRNSKIEYKLIKVFYDNQKRGRGKNKKR